MFLLSAFFSFLTGCGTYQYQVKTWPYVFFIDSSKVGLLGEQYIETYPRFDENYAAFSDCHVNLWSCPKDGILKVEWELAGPIITPANWSGFIAYPFLLVKKYSDRGVIIDVSTMQKSGSLPETDHYIAFTWDWKYYFFTDNPDTNFLYNTNTNDAVATFGREIPVNLDRTGSRFLVTTYLGLQYFNLKDNSISTIRAKPVVVITDYRFGRVALAMLDSTVGYTMIPDFDTLSAPLSHFSWEKTIGSDRIRRSVFNLKNGDYAYEDTNGNAVVANVLAETVRVIAEFERKSIQ